MTAPRSDAAGASADAPRKILVVDDERDLANLTEALLDSCGLAVLVAYSAEAALRALEADQDIDALFSDVMMPGMTGLQLANTVRERYPHVRIVLTSGYISPALLAGQEVVYPFVAKPYRVETLLHMLQISGRR